MQRSPTVGLCSPAVFMALIPEYYGCMWLMVQLIRARTRRAAPKWMPPVLLRWPVTSEADDGGMSVEVEKMEKSGTHWH